ncbi:VWA domain-containing protein, partial [Nocardia sp. NPDC004722]
EAVPGAGPQDQPAGQDESRDSDESSETGMKDSGVDPETRDGDPNPRDVDPETSDGGPDAADGGPNSPGAEQDSRDPWSSGHDPRQADDPRQTNPGQREPSADRPAREGRTGAPTAALPKPPRWEVPGVGEGAPGRRSRARTRQGRVVHAIEDTSTGLHLLGTIFAAVPHQHERGRLSGRLAFAPADLRGAYREGREGNLVVFVVDTSGSMAARDRLSAVTNAVVALLRDAYQRRDKVAVITVRGQDAELVLPPTSSVDIAVRRLADLRTGGKTPLAQGLLKARDLLRRERVRDPHRRPLLVLLTDGRATGGTDPVPRARAAARMLANDAVTAMVVDCERGMIRLGLARDLAAELRGGYLQLSDLTGDSVAGIVRATRAA